MQGKLRIGTGSDPSKGAISSAVQRIGYIAHLFRFAFNPEAFPKIFNNSAMVQISEELGLRKIAASSAYKLVLNQADGT